MERSMKHELSLLSSHSAYSGNEVFKSNFCSLQLLMVLEKVTLWHLWEKPAIYLIHFAFLLVNNNFRKIISTAKGPHNFFCLLPGLLLHTAILQKCGEANVGLAYWLKSMKCEHKQINPDSKALSSNFCLFSIAPFIHFNKRFQMVWQIMIIDRLSSSIASFPTVWAGNYDHSPMRFHKNLSYWEIKWVFGERANVPVNQIILPLGNFSKVTNIRQKVKELWTGWGQALPGKEEKSLRMHVRALQGSFQIKILSDSFLVSVQCKLMITDFSKEAKISLNWLLKLHRAYY